MKIEHLRARDKRGNDQHVKNTDDEGKEVEAEATMWSLSGILTKGEQGR